MVVETSGEMTAGADTFLVTLHLDASEQGRRVASRQWRLETPRDGI